jgi:PEP-CTERM motif
MKGDCMFNNRFIPIVAFIGLLACACAGGPSLARAGSVSYLVTVDTTGGAGQTGFLDAQLAAAAPPAVASVTATISNYTSNATGGPVTIAVGDVSGSFTSTPLVLGNDNAGSSVPGLSELQQMGTAGTFLSFTLTLAGSEVNGGSGVPFTGTVFSFLLEDANQNGLSQGPLAGEAFDIYVNPGGSLTVTPNDPYIVGGPVPGYAPASGNYPQVTISPAAVAIPEPSSVVLMGLGLGAVAVVGRFRKRRAA